MTTETIETPATSADPEPEVQPQTEEPTPVVEPAAAEPEADAVPQVEIVEAEKPDYMTRADWEREKSLVEQRAASDALELDRRRRQTEGARRAQQDKRDADDLSELYDTAKATFGAAGVYEVPHEPLVKAVDRLVQKRSGQIAGRSFDAVGPILAYLGGATDELDPNLSEASNYLRPMAQAFVDHVKGRITAEARKGYIPEADVPKLKAQWAEAQAAKSREGQEELKHVEGSAASGVMSWAAYSALPETDKLAMPASQRQAIMAADRKARLGQ